MHVGDNKQTENNLHHIINTHMNMHNLHSLHLQLIHYRLLQRTTHTYIHVVYHVPMLCCYTTGKPKDRGYNKNYVLYPRPLT